MELINEINTIKNLMNLEVLNEAGPGSWLDDVWKATKGILSKYINKSSIDSLIKDGFDEDEFKVLKNAILESSEGQLGVELKTSLKKAKEALPPTATAERLLIDTRIRQIDDLITQSTHAFKFGDFVKQLEDEMKLFTTKNKTDIARDAILMVRVNKMKDLITKLNTNAGKQLYEQISNKDVTHTINLAKTHFPNTWNRISAKYLNLPTKGKSAVIAFILFAGLSCYKQKNCKTFINFLKSMGTTLQNFVSGIGGWLFDDENDDIVAPD